MTDITANSLASKRSFHTSEAAARRLAKRYAAERRFRTYGLIAILFALAALSVLLVSIISKGWSGFLQSTVTLEIFFDPNVIDPEGTRDPDTLSSANYRVVARDSFRALFPDVDTRERQRRLDKLLSSGAAFELRDVVMKDPSVIGTTRNISLRLDDLADQYLKGFITAEGEAIGSLIAMEQVDWIERLKARHLIELKFNSQFFSAADSREPEDAGIAGALLGSFYTLMIALLFSFPIGVSTAIYLEQFAPKNRWTDLIEVNINNLAAVPSIVFGLLGLAVLLNVFGLPRSTPLVGGMVLSLMNLPIIIIASRAALRAVPPSIKEGALGVGASDVQAVIHHVLPLAMPGIMTGTIIGMAHALGETAPLLMIGMVAFIVDVPQGITDPATVLPVQIYLWADSSERAFVEKTSAAIMVLLVFLICMNGLAVFLRKKFERRW